MPLVELTPFETRLVASLQKPRESAREVELEGDAAGESADADGSESAAQSPSSPYTEAVSESAARSYVSRIRRAAGSRLTSLAFLADFPAVESRLHGLAATTKRGVWVAIVSVLAPREDDPLADAKAAIDSRKYSKALEAASLEQMRAAAARREAVRSGLAAGGAGLPPLPHNFVDWATVKGKATVAMATAAVKMTHAPPLSSADRRVALAGLAAACYTEAVPRRLLEWARAAYVGGGGYVLPPGIPAGGGDLEGGAERVVAPTPWDASQSNDLELPDGDDEPATLLLRSHKTSGRGRAPTRLTVPSGPAVQLLKAWRRHAPPNGVVFSRSDGTPCGTDGVSAALKAAGLPSVGLLRKAHATATLDVDGMEADADEAGHTLSTRLKYYAQSRRAPPATGPRPRKARSYAQMAAEREEDRGEEEEEEVEDDRADG